MSCYVHNVPGRLRIKSHSLKYRPKQCRAAQETLSLMKGVEEVRAKASIGSITVMYDREETNAEILLQALEEKKVIKRPASNGEDSFYAKAMSEAGEKAGKAIFGYVVEQTLKANGLSFLAALI